MCRNSDSPPPPRYKRRYKRKNTRSPFPQICPISQMKRIRLARIAVSSAGSAVFGRIVDFLAVCGAKMRHPHRPDRRIVGVTAFPVPFCPFRPQILGARHARGPNVYVAPRNMAHWNVYVSERATSSGRRRVRDTQHAPRHPPDPVHRATQGDGPGHQSR